MKRILEIRDSLINDAKEDSRIKNVRDTLFDLSVRPGIDINDYFPPIFLRKDYDKNVQSFKGEEFTELMRLAYRYKNELEKPSPEDETFSFVHPFYPFLRHINLVTQEREEWQTKLLDYYTRLEILLLRPINKRVFITPDSFLLTLGVWDDVMPSDIVFTEHSRGHLLDPKDLGNLGYVSGCYLGHCIDDIIGLSDDYLIIDELCLHRPTDTDVPAIRDYCHVSINCISIDKN